MRPLRTCDFCDDDAVGAFEVVPPELQPTEDEQRRVVCCADCSDRLETLLEPLVARALEAQGSLSAVDATADSTRTRTERSNATVSAAEPGSDTDSIGEAGITFDAAESTADPDPGESSDRIADETTSTDDPGDLNDSVPADDAPGDTDASEDGDSNEDESEKPDRPDGAAAADEESDTSDDIEADDAGIDLESDGDSTADPETRDDATADTAPETGGDTEAAAESATRPPHAYGKVVRLLRNREFPMERDAVEQLAASAYNLEDPAVERIVDYAVATDEFVERGGKLHRA